MPDEFRTVVLEGFDGSGGDFQDIVERDIILDIPLDLFKYYGTNYASSYGYSL